MNHTLSTLSAFSLFAAFASAQNTDILYSTSQVEQTVSGSGGTVLQTIYPNEIVGLKSLPCPMLAEKWMPRSGFHTIAGDEDNDDSYWEPGMFGQIDALLSFDMSGIGLTNQREVWFSPSVAMGTTISGGPGLRPGDVGRIVVAGGSDGQVQHFITAETIQIALGLPPSPVVIDVDAVAWMPNMGIFLSLDDDIVCTPCGGPTLLNDGAIFAIGPADYVMSGGVITGAAPGSAIVVYTEAMMDAFVANANVTDRFGTCVTNAIDIESLEIDRTSSATTTFIPGCYGSALAVPRLMFTAETLTGGAILTTAFGGSIFNSTCWPMGTGCGWGPTYGPQVGLQPAGTIGMASYIDALAGHNRIFEFAAEAVNPQIPAFTATQIDFVTPLVPWTWVFMSWAPAGPGAIKISAPFTWGFMGFPDYFPVPNFMGMIPTAPGFGSYTTPVIPFPVDMVFQGFTILGTNIEASTPTMVEVY